MFPSASHLESSDMWKGSRFIEANQQKHDCEANLNAALVG